MRYTVLYADPPWKYEFSETKSRRIENKYPTMELEEIKSLPISDIADEDSVLFLWATAPKLKEALEVMVAWGFDYRTCCVWDKKIIGMGYWFRGQHELLLVGVRGDIKRPIAGNRRSSVYREKRTKHSKKPHAFYKFIEDMMGDVPRVELFARHRREGWDVWGLEAPNDIQKTLEGCWLK